MTIDFGPVFANLPFLIAGLEGTLTVSAGALLVGAALGLAIALLRLSPSRPLQFLGGLYVDFVRSVPLLILLVLFVYAVPIVVENLTGRSLRIDALVAGILGLGLYAAAYLAEVFRAGILAVPSGQREAALSTGMTNRQAFRRIVLPQAGRKIIPPATSTVLSLVKDSAVTFAIAVPELIAKAGSLNNGLQRPIEVFLVVAGIYLVITYPLLLLSERLQRSAASSA
jgi:His/Glu/Gln/Arg/opine family amino acid ABC transporter permease subunit